jgi:hypothetical protein
MVFYRIWPLTLSNTIGVMALPWWNTLPNLGETCYGNAIWWRILCHKNGLGSCHLPSISNGKPSGTKLERGRSHFSSNPSRIKVLRLMLGDIRFEQSSTVTVVFSFHDKRSQCFTSFGIVPLPQGCGTELPRSSAKWERDALILGNGPPLTWPQWSSLKNYLQTLRSWMLSEFSSKEPAYGPYGFKETIKFSLARPGLTSWSSHTSRRQWLSMACLPRIRPWSSVSSSPWRLLA